MSTTTDSQRPLGPTSHATGSRHPVPDENLARPASEVPDTARAIAVRAGQLLVWVLVTAPIALVLTGLCLALIGAALALFMG